MLSVKVTLRAFSAQLSLHDLIDVLGEPTKGHSIGDAVAGRPQVHPSTYWAREARAPENETLESKIQEMLGFFEDRADAVSQLRARCDLDLFCMLATDNGQGSASLSSATIRRLGASGIPIHFDVYAD
jgi:Domain of unknown function (DUF4279)